MTYTVILGSLVAAAMVVAGTRYMVAAHHKHDPIRLRLDDEKRSI